MRVLLFGIAKEIAGKKEIAVDETIKSVGELKVYLNEKYPSLQRLKSFAVAVDSEYATDDMELHYTNEIALIPPVSGG